jgi:type VI secretion system secreted protein Hcp
MAQISAYLFLCEESNDGAAGTAFEVSATEMNQQQIAGVDVSTAIEVLDVDSSVSVGIQRRTAQATGDRTHAPIKIRKRIDSTSPELMRAACQSTRLVGELKFFRPTSATGGLEHFYTIKFSDARVQEITMQLPEGLEDERVMEDVSFAFSRCAWKHETASKEFEDNWRERVAG